MNIRKLSFLSKMSLQTSAKIPSSRIAQCIQCTRKQVSPQSSSNNYQRPLLLLPIHPSTESKKKIEAPQREIKETPMRPKDKLIAQVNQSFPTATSHEQKNETAAVCLDEEAYGAAENTRWGD